MRTISFSTIWEQVRSQKKNFWESNIYGFFSTLLLLPIPLLIPLLVDELLLHHPGKLTDFFSTYFHSDAPWFLIISVTGLILILRGLAFWTSNRQTYHALRISQRLAYALRHRILYHLERLALPEYERLRSGGIVTRSLQDVESLAGFSSQVVTTALSSFLMLVGVAAILFWINWQLALLVFLINPFFFGLAKILGRKSGKYLRRQHEAYQLYQELLTEVLELFIQVRVSNQERHFFGLVRERAKGIEKASLDYGYQATLITKASALTTTTGLDLLRALGIAAVVYSDLSIGMMIAFLFYLSTLTQPLNQLLNLLISYRRTLPAVERINDLFALRQEPVFPQKYNPFHDRQPVSASLHSVCFAYPEGGEILHNITLEIKAGERVALIGPSGNGKSTIAKLLVGFYLPQKGTILYNDIPLQKIGLERVRSHVGLMLQDSLFFNDTIRMNLTLGEKIPETKIHEALRMAQMESFVRGLKSGLDTPIGRNGIRLSGGQRQRLAIARLILSDPRVVIFDEATSALDSETEASLFQSLKPFFNNRTVLIIAHRETTIRQTQRILVIGEGRIQAEGSYEQLKAQGFFPAELDNK